MNDTTSYNQSFIDSCCLTCRVMFMNCRLVFVTRRPVFVTCRLVCVTRRFVFVTGRLVFVTRRFVFVTRRVQKCSHNKFSESFIFVSSSQTPIGTLPPQSIHLCYIGVLSFTRVGNSLYNPKVYVIL